MSPIFSTRLILCFLIINVVLTTLIGNADCLPVQGNKPAPIRTKSLRSDFLQKIKPTSRETAHLNAAEKGHFEHTFEKKPDSPRLSRVNSKDREHYSLLRQKEQTFGRIAGIGKETVHDQQGKDKMDVYMGGGMSGQLSRHAGQQADKLLRPVSPVKTSHTKH